MHGGALGANQTISSQEHGWLTSSRVAGCRLALAVYLQRAAGCSNPAHPPAGQLAVRAETERADREDGIALAPALSIQAATDPTGRDCGYAAKCRLASFAPRWFRHLTMVRRS